MSMIMIGRGDCHLGLTKRDAQGNVVEQSGAKWEPSDEGGCVAVCTLDPETMEPTGTTEIYGDWDAAHFLPEVLKKLGPGRPVNVPDFRAILKAAIEYGEGKSYFCDLCERCDCRDCIVTEWLGELGEK